MAAASLAAGRASGKVWKFGYGSNMGQKFLREKKGLNPLDYRRTVLKGFDLFFPSGMGIDFVEPCFSTMKVNDEGEVHGVSTLFSIEDAEKLDKQEQGYNIKVFSVKLYPGETVEGSDSIDVEVYVPKQPLDAKHPAGVCSARYRGRSREKREHQPNCKSTRD